MLPSGLCFIALACLFPVDQTTVIHQPANVDSGQSADGVCKGNRAFIGRYTAAMQPAVDLDQDGNLFPDPLSECGKLLCAVNAVDLCADPDTLHQAA